MKTTDVNQNLKGAKNIGATILKQLNKIGIFTLADLTGITPAKAYLKICKHNPGKTFPVCYYLYSLQGALLDMHWDNLPKKMKQELLKEAGR
jgi:DNA transformation protein and related proteins